MNKPLGLYIHIPFCKQKCSYCDFYSRAAHSDETENYIRSLKGTFSGLKDYVAGRSVSSVYIGGGTPSLLGKNIVPLMKSVFDNFDVLPQAEITAEANPESAKDFLQPAMDAGINRISIGIQSSSDKMLKTLGRLHNPDEAKAAVLKAESVGFKNISGDLMIALPGSDISDLDRDIDFLLSLPLNHISTYILKAEKNTPLYSKRSLLPNEDTAAKMYLHTCWRLQNAGFSHYEISNFAKPGFEGKHNLGYWQCGEYLGVGPGAHSFINGKRFYYPRDLKSFLMGNKPLFEDEGGSLSEKFMLALRLKTGVLFVDYPFLKKEAAKEKIARLEAAGYLNKTDKGISLTDKGFLVSNTIITELLYENL